MKRLLLTALLVTSPLICSAGVSLNINLGDPGFYGPVDIVGAPAPRYIYNTPRIVIQGRHSYPPLYLRVPVIYTQNWPRYCHYYDQYNACNRPVYFVQDDWYLNSYSTYYHHRHGYNGGYNDGRRSYNDGRRYYNDGRRGYNDRGRSYNDGGQGYPRNYSGNRADREESKNRNRAAISSPNNASFNTGNRVVVDPNSNNAGNRVRYGQ